MFLPQERWGWEFVDPGSATPSPDLGRKPVWDEPPLEDVRHLERRRAEFLKKLPKRAVVVLVLGFLGLLFWSIFSNAFLLVVTLGVAALWFAPFALASNKINAARRNWESHREAEWYRYQADLQEWQAAVDQHEEAERRRLESSLLWFPLQLRSGPSRIDVFGGTSDGWASLLATLGSTVLASGSGVLLLDFSENNVGSGLTNLATSRGFPVRELSFPADFHRVDLFRGLSNEDLAELLADAMHSMRQTQTGDNADLRAMDADLIRAVADRLDGSPTFARLAAGLRVLERLYDGSEDGPLTVPEVGRLTSCVDSIGHTERVQNEVPFVRRALDLLAAENRTDLATVRSPEDEIRHERADQAGPAGPADQTGSAGQTGRAASGDQAGSGDLWPRGGITVLATSNPNERRKDFTDRVLFQMALHHVRTRSSQGSRDVLVVAGADHLGRTSLESMARQARIARIRLVFLLEHLRGELQQLLGSSDSAAVLMRLGNAQEAEEAAKFIGREHTFVLSQVTRQVGKTFTGGGGESWGTQVGVSETEGRSWGSSSASKSFSRNQGGSTSVSRSLSRTWQGTKNWSAADSATDGTTDSRVYEFAVEPTQIQSLPTTAFILVETGHSGRRVVVGDCNPGVVFLDKVSAEPRTS